jgi:hypothetical protein
MQGLEQEGDESERSSLCDESERSLLSSPGRARTEVPSKCTTRAAPSGPLSSSILLHVEHVRARLPAISAELLNF